MCSIKRRVLVLLGDDRVLQRLAELPERTRALRLDHEHVARRQARRAPCDERRRSAPASWPAAAPWRPGSGWPSLATLTTSRSTSGIASKTFSRNRLPGVTRVTFWRDAAWAGSPRRCCRPAGRRRGRSRRAAGRLRRRSSRRPGPCARRAARFSGTTSIGSSSRSSSSRHDDGLVRGVGDLDQDLVADRVEQAAAGLEPGDAARCRSSCRSRSARRPPARASSAAPSKPPSESTTTLRDLLGAGEQPAGQRDGLGRPGSVRRSARSSRAPRAGCAGGRSARRRPAAAAPPR